MWTVVGSCTRRVNSKPTTKLQEFSRQFTYGSRGIKFRYQLDPIKEDDTHQMTTHLVEIMD
jgi:hypothetical protein